MSGNSGSGDGGFGGPDSRVSCEDLKFSTTLTSVNNEVLPKVIVGEELDVVLDDRDEVPSIQARTNSGESLGAIVDSVPELLRCLRGGTSYRGEILKINGGEVRIEVSAV